MKKIMRELKWLAVSMVIVAVAIGTLYGITTFAQWKVELNMAQVDVAEAQLTNYSIWK